MRIKYLLILICLCLCCSVSSQDTDDPLAPDSIDKIQTGSGTDQSTVDAQKKSIEEQRKKDKDAKNKVKLESGNQSSEASPVLSKNREEIVRGLKEFRQETNWAILSLAFLFLIFAFMVGVIRAKSDFNEMAKLIVATITVIALIWGFESACLFIQGEIKAFTYMHSFKVERMLFFWGEIAIEEEAGWSMANFAQELMGAIAKWTLAIATGVGLLVKWVSFLVIEFLLLFCYMFAPLTLSMLLLQETRSSAINFLQTVVSFLIIPIAFIFADYAILALAAVCFDNLGTVGAISGGTSGTVLATAAVGGAVAGGTTGLTIGALFAIEVAIILLTLMVFLYLLFPIMLMVLLKGGSPAQGIMGSFMMAQGVMAPLKAIQGSIQQVASTAAITAATGGAGGAAAAGGGMMPSLGGSGGGGASVANLGDMVSQSLSAPPPGSSQEGMYDSNNFTAEKGGGNSSSYSEGGSGGEVSAQESNSGYGNSESKNSQGGGSSESSSNLNISSSDGENEGAQVDQTVNAQLTQTGGNQGAGSVSQNINLSGGSSSPQPAMPPPDPYSSAPQSFMGNNDAPPATKPYNER